MSQLINTENGNTNPEGEWKEAECNSQAVGGLIWAVNIYRVKPEDKNTYGVIPSPLNMVL